MIKKLFAVCFIVFTAFLHAQLEEEQESRTAVKVINFSDMFEKEEMNRQEFLQKQELRSSALEIQSLPSFALDKTINPDTYIVGPGDIFEFNVWGAVELHYSVQITPEGYIALSAVGDIQIGGLTLSAARDTVLARARLPYRKNRISFSLISPRHFRVYVAGEVIYPGAFTAVAVDRISELIVKAGGMTNMAWKAGVQLIRGADTLAINLNRFLYEGSLKDNPYVESGDIIVVPAMDLLSMPTVQLEGNLEIAGTYQIHPDEPLRNFLKRVNAEKPNVDYQRIIVTREENNRIERLHPFKSDSMFCLKSGDRVILPSNYVFVEGRVSQQGAYNYVRNLTVRDYVIMAGARGRMSGVWVLHQASNKKEHGPDAPVYPGDIIHMPRTFEQYFQGYFGIVSTLSSLLLSAIAIGMIGSN